MNQHPTVGRIVHYQSFGTPEGEYVSETRAAIVTAVYADSLRIGLAILNPTGLFFNTGVPFSDVPMAGHWSWPPRT